MKNPEDRGGGSKSRRGMAGSTPKGGVCSGETGEVFLFLPAEVFPFVRGCFPVSADIFYCPQLWVVQPITVSCITHNCGSYNP